MLARRPARASAPPTTNSSIWSEPVGLSAGASAAASVTGAGDAAGFALGCASDATGATGGGAGAAAAAAASGQRAVTAGGCALLSGLGLAACGAAAGAGCAVGRGALRRDVFGVRILKRWRRRRNPAASRCLRSVSWLRPCRLRHADTSTDAWSSVRGDRTNAVPAAPRPSVRRGNRRLHSPCLLGSLRSDSVHLARSATRRPTARRQ